MKLSPSLKRTCIALFAAGTLMSAAFWPVAAGAQGLTKMVFGTDWFAQAEHGGYYQAIAEGTYRKHGLDVSITMGGPQVNGLQLLLAGKIDVYMGYAIQTLKVQEQNLPVVAIAATFQKDPTVIISHPGVTKLEDLKGMPIAIGAASDNTFWPWLRESLGFTDAQKRPYGFSVQPFLADKRLSQQGFATSEPYSIEKGGVKPVVFLLADRGYPSYAETLVVTRDTLGKRGDALKKFVLASAEGWKSYLANPAPGNVLIKKDNPQMEDGLLAFGHSKMKEYGLVTGGDAGKQGILTMTDDRWKKTYDFMVNASMLNRKVDVRRAYTLDMVKDSKVLP